MISDTIQHIGEPGAGIDIVKSRRDDERIHCGRSLAAAVTTREQPGLPAERHAAQRAFGRVVCETNASIVQEASERLPPFEHVIHRLRDIGVAREPAAFGSHPLLERGHERCDPDLPDGMPLRGRQTVDLTLDIKDCIDPPHRLDRQRRFGNIGKLEQMASAVAPACRFGDRGRLAANRIEIVEAIIGIGLQDPAIAGQMPARMLATAIARVVEHGGRMRRTAKRAIIAHIDPKPAGDGLACRQYRHRGVITMKTLGTEHMAADDGNQRCQAVVQAPTQSASVDTLSLIPSCANRSLWRFSG